MRLLAEDRLEPGAVGVKLAAAGLADTQRAFDAVAPSYDGDNAANPLICAMRARTMSLLTSLVGAGASLLDLGCGPGCDAEQLARRGYHVTAVDWSSAMVSEARRRIAAAGLDVRARTRHLGIHDLDRLDEDAFDGAYSNLGPLNCVPDLAAAAAAIGRKVRPGGVVVASVIGRLCPWELARYGVTGHWRRATLRFASRFVPVPLEGRTVWTRYYRPREFARTFEEAGFSTARLEALGLFLPPPYLLGTYRRHAGLMRGLDAIERRTASWPGLRQLGDHFLIALRRR